MALVNIREVYPGVMLGLWQTTETAEEFFQRYSFLDAYREHVAATFKSEGRKTEFLAVHALLHDMLAICGKTGGGKEANGKTGKENAEAGKACAGNAVAAPLITHAQSGQPLLRRWHIGVTHTKGYAALIMSKKMAVACDIEYISDRVERIKSKFMRKDEQADGLDSLLVHWCGKETVYKLFPDDNLQFSQMRVRPFSTMSDWACEIDNLKRRLTVRVDFELTMQFVLTYAAVPLK